KLLRQADWYFRGTNRARASLLRGKSRTAPLAEALDDGVLAGRSVRLADVAEESRVYGDRDSDAGPRNWSEHGAIFSRQWRAVESVALPAPGAVADGVFEDASVPGKLDQLSQFSGLAEEQQQFFGIGGLSQQRFQFDGTGRSGTAAGLHDFGGFFSRARRERGEGAHVSTRGGSAGGGAGGAHQRGPVEEKIRRRGRYCRQKDRAERNALHDRRSDSGQLSTAESAARHLHANWAMERPDIPRPAHQHGNERGGTAESRSQRETGAIRHGCDRPKSGGGVSGIESRIGDQPGRLEEGSGWGHRAVSARAFGGGSIRAADSVRERGQSLAGAIHGEEA